MTTAAVALPSGCNEKFMQRQFICIVHVGMFGATRDHENALTGFTKESRNIGDLKPFVFVCHEGGFRAAGI